jgi:hypothetical protein
MAEARKLRRVSMRPARLSVRDYRLSGTELQVKDPAKRAEGIRLPAFLGIRRAAQSQDCFPRRDAVSEAVACGRRRLCCGVSATPPLPVLELSRQRGKIFRCSKIAPIMHRPG